MRTAKPRCEVCEFLPESVFSSLNRSLLRELDSAKTFHLFQKGQLIFSEGTPPFAVYGIHSGLVKLFKTGPRAEPQVIRLLRPCGTMGFRPLLANEPYAATAEALLPAGICIIPKQVIYDLIRKSNPFTFRLLEKQALDLRISEEQMLGLTQKSVKQRVAELLLHLFETLQPKAGDRNSIKLPITKKEVAQIIGTTPETLSRSFKSLTADGTVRLLDRTTIRVQNLSQLKKNAGA